MSYELAKELKDAGYPGADAAVFEPTLHDLIVACGEGFMLFSPGTEIEWTQPNEFGSEKVLIENGVLTEWAACFDMNTTTAKASGETPEEAVARLWISLGNKA